MAIYASTAFPDSAPSGLIVIIAGIMISVSITYFEVKLLGCPIGRNVVFEKDMQLSKYHWSAGVASILAFMTLRISVLIT